MSLIPVGSKLCSTCNQPTISMGTMKCDVCWEIEKGLARYLDRGGANARAFVRMRLNEAEESP